MELARFSQKWTRSAKHSGFDKNMEESFASRGLVHFSTYNRELGTRKKYNAYLFIASFSNEQELYNVWQNLNENIAVTVQSGIESLIERSNFYLCLFVTGNVSEENVRLIESDTYCAKKYVFPSFDGTQAEAVQIVESRIFSLNSLVGNNCPPSGIKSLEANNFRVFQKSNFDFTVCGDSNPAGLVVIYAPNGVGKTSVCDAIEWGLTGKIYRFENIGTSQRDRDTRRNAQGLLLHNRQTHKTIEEYKAAHEKSYVKIVAILEGQVPLELQRTVRNAESDYTVGKTSGTKEWDSKSTQWETVILPHDKIEKFVSAIKPEDRFDEWTSCLNKPEEKQLLREYKKTNSTIKNQKRRLQNAEKDVETAKQELKNLEENRSVWEALQASIKKYNALFPRKVLNENIANSAEYNALQASVIGLSEKRKADISSYKEQASLINYYLNSDGKNFNELIRVYSLYNQQIEKIKKNIDDRKTYNSLQSKRDKLQSQLKYQNQLLSLSKVVVAYGEKEVLRLVATFPLLDDNITEYEAQTQKYKKQYEQSVLILEQLSNKFLEIEGEKKKNQSIREKLTRTLQEYLSVSALIEKKKNEIAEQMQTVSLQKMSFQQETNKQRALQIKGKEIPRLEELEGWLEEHTEQDVEINEKILYFIQKYRALRDGYNQYIKELSLAEQADNELNELKRNGQLYLKKHQNQCDCPLCGTKFNNWEALYASIVELHQSQVERLQETGVHYKELKEKLKSEYLEFQNKWQNSINIALQVQSQKCEQLKQSLQQEERILADMRSSVGELTSKRKSIFDSVEATGFPKSQEFTENTIEDYLSALDRKIEQKYKSLENEKREYEVKSKNIKGLYQKLQDKLDSMLQDKKKLMANTALNDCISFAVAAADTLAELPKKPAIIQEEIDNIRTKLEENLELLSKYHNVSQTSLEQYMKELQCVLSGKETTDFKYDQLKHILGTESISIATLTEKRKELTSTISQLQAEIEQLALIINFRGVQEYLENYNSRKTEFSKCKEKLDSIKSDIEREKVKQREQNTHLCDALKQRFGQKLFNEIYQKIDPHPRMKSVDYQIDDQNEDGKLRLNITVSAKDQDAYQPEWFFSTAQLNSVALSSFLSLAIQADAQSLNIILIDDPVGHFDDLNILGFADLLRSILEVANKQIIITTHDETVFQIIRRKLPSEYYRTRYIALQEEFRRRIPTIPSIEGG